MLTRELMKSPVVTVGEEASLRQAMALMAERRIRRLPVVQDGRLVGIVTDRDCRKAWTSSAAPLARYELAYLLDELRVKEVMSRDVIAVTPDTPVREVARLIRSNKIGGLPVVEGDAVVGIVTTTELLGAVTRVLEERYPTGIEEILVPTDFSESSVRAVHHAESLARRHGATVRILHVVPRTALAQVEVPLPQEALEAVRAGREREALERLAAMFPDGGRNGYEVATGYPEQEIVRAAKTGQADLIVMAAHKRTKLGQLLAGSVTEAVLRTAPCPVLVLHD